MPYVNITKPPEHANKNTGSSQDLVDYLEKENFDKDMAEREYFFSHAEDIVLPEEVIHTIDNNKLGLKDSETKFYELSVSFSQKEMQHLNAITDSAGAQRSAIQGYIREVMDEYAHNFNRTIDGRPLNGQDLVYFAKIERDRRYHPDTRNEELKKAYKQNYEIRNRINELKASSGKEKAIGKLDSQYIRNANGTVILPGNVKDGDNTHVHIIVSRRDKSQRVSLSPQANSKGSHNKLNGREVRIGFNRDQFVENAERIFDHKFEYARSLKEHYRQRHIAKSAQLNAARYAHLIRDPERFAQNLSKQLIRRAVKQGLSNLLRSAGKGHLVPAIQQMLTSNQGNLINLATQQLSRNLLTSGAIYKITSKIPVPAVKVVNAIVLAHSLIKSQSHQHSKSHGNNRKNNSDGIGR